MSYGLAPEFTLSFIEGVLWAMGKLEKLKPQSEASSECEARPHTSNPERISLQFPKEFELRLCRTFERVTFAALVAVDSHLLIDFRFFDFDGAAFFQCLKPLRFVNRQNASAAVILHDASRAAVIAHDGGRARNRTS